MSVKQRRPSRTELELSKQLAERLEAWFVANGRTFPWRSWTDEYRVTVVELLLQRTRAESVKDFVGEFFEMYPNWRALEDAPQRELEDVLSALGLQTRRTSALKALAHDRLRNERPVSEDSPGVGQYVARAVEVMTLGTAAAMVDSNWVRVFKRVFGGRWMSDYRYDQRLQALAQSTVREARNSACLNWAVLDLGATICKIQGPVCRTCPLSELCKYSAKQRLHAQAKASRSTASAPA